ncbi:MAG: AroM family protein [Peptostreptococcaceae bacterium]
MKIGGITIGQSPRIDVTSDIMKIFDGKIELLEAGGLDNLTKEDIEKFAPEDGDYVLVSRLKDGSSVTFAEKHIIPRLQECIYELESKGVSLIMFFCTGQFPYEFDSKVPIVFPCDILDRIIPLLSKDSSIAVLTPSELQLEQSKFKWEEFVKSVKVVAASPYENLDRLEEVARSLRDEDLDLVVLDCIGYSQDMKEVVARESGKNVILSRTMLARVISEITDI